MTDNQQYVPADVSVKKAGLEAQLAAVLRLTTQQIAHSECFDDEQRAEVYSILHALKSDTEQHQTVIGRWVSHKMTENSCA